MNAFRSPAVPRMGRCIIVIDRDSPRRQSGFRAGSRRASTFVEFVLVCPLVLLSFLVAFEFARVLMVRHTIDNAVYEAARAGTLPGSSVADVETEARRALSAIGLIDARIEVTPRSLSRDTQHVTVRITAPMSAGGYVPTHYLSGRTIVRELTMRREGVR